MVKKFMLILITLLVGSYASKVSEIQPLDTVINGFRTTNSGRTWFPEPPKESEEYHKTISFPKPINTYVYEILARVPYNCPLMAFGDADHDGKFESYQESSNSIAGVRVYEFDKDLNHTITDLEFDRSCLCWDVGDPDNDGLTDMVAQTGDPGLPDQGNGYLRVYESPDPNSFPTLLKEELVFPGRKVIYYARIVDTDQDGKKEVLVSVNGMAVADGKSMNGRMTD